MIFKCKKCDGVFEADGIQIVVHEQTIGRVCPSCIAGAKHVQLVLYQKSPGQPYELKHVEITLRQDK